MTKLASNRSMGLAALSRASSALALAIGLSFGTGGIAYGQAFQGTPTVGSGTVNIDRATPGLDTITVSSNQAVINWTTTDTGIGGGEIDFLPTNATAIFRNDGVLTNNFTVLNRIIPTDTTRAIALNGQIQSLLFDGQGLSAPGGGVWFYSPGGIVIGSSAVIDVGSLLLTSADVVVDGQGDFLTPNAGGQLAQFVNAVSGTAIDIRTGASITASPQSSYVTAIAPVIRQAGTVNVNGTAAYVAAEQVDITFNTNGLFDISVTVGTDGDANNSAINHTGSTTGPASSGAGDNHRIYMVAVPKNTAITMAVGAGSQLGFDIAGAADVVGNAIVLLSGFDTRGDFLGMPFDRSLGADLSITNANITSAITAQARANAFATGDGTTLSFASDATIRGGGLAQVAAFNGGGNVTIGGNLVVSAENTPIGFESLLAGTATVVAGQGGSVSVVGNVTLNARGQGGDAFSGGTAGSGFGGSALIQIQNGSSIDIGGSVALNATGAGGTAFTGAGAGTGVGGTASISSSGGVNLISIGGDVLLDASGFGSDDAAGLAGGSGTGGTAVIQGFGDAGSLIDIAGSVTAFADGSGGNAFTGTNGGNGSGGNASIFTNGDSDVQIGGFLFASGSGDGGVGGSAGVGGIGAGGTASINVNGAGGGVQVLGGAALIADGDGGGDFMTGAIGGAGNGGNANLFASAGIIDIQNGLTLSGAGFGGQAQTGGNGDGGVASINASNGATISVSSASGPIFVSAIAQGGEAGAMGGLTSGDALGGSALITAQTNGTVNLTGSVIVDADAGFDLVEFFQPAGVDGGNAQGGDASLFQSGGGAITVNGTLAMSANGQGTPGSGGGDLISGTGRGGTVNISADAQQLAVTGDVILNAIGYGGPNFGGSAGGAGFGGSINLGSGGGILDFGAGFLAQADGFGGSGTDGLTLLGSGGAGTGGNVNFNNTSAAGQIRFALGLSASADGFGGTARGTGNIGGAGTAGNVNVFAGLGLISLAGDLSLSAAGNGGNGSVDAAGGAATGGGTRVTTQGTATIQINGLAQLTSSAFGGDAGGATAASGAATAGNAVIEATGAGSTIVANSVNLAGEAFSGDVVAGVAGAALGGGARLNAQSGSIIVGGPSSMRADAFGGNATGGGTAGAATGGNAQSVIFGSGGGTIAMLDSVEITAVGSGGNAINGGISGAGTGGLAEFGTLNILGTLSAGGVTIVDASGIGGSGGIGGTGTGRLATVGVGLGSITGGTIAIVADGTGGDGSLGGNGGNGVGGTARVGTTLANLGTGVVQFSSATIAARGFGGDGGAGVDGVVGGAGGAGGTATGGGFGPDGVVNALASAGTGNLQLGTLNILANAVGGAGGAGGAGISGAGGAGGVGGASTGGFINFGTASGQASATNDGTSNFGSVSSSVTAIGGAGGAGGAGTPGAGIGGSGGAAVAGSSTLLVRGSLVTTGNVAMDASATGGAGGAGSVQGNGGNASSGSNGLLVTDRFQIPTDRGVLQAGAITTVAQSLGGAGAVTGASLYGGNVRLIVRNSDATIASVNMDIDGLSPNGAVGESAISVVNGTTTVTGQLAMSTPGALSVLVDNGTLNTGSLLLSAGDFIADTVTTPSVPGTINTGTANITSAGNVLVSANFGAGTALNVNAPGAVTLLDIIGSAPVSLNGTSVTTGSILSGGAIDIQSTGGAVVTGDLNSGGAITILADGGSVTSGNVTAVGSVAMESLTGGITTGNVTSGEFIDIDAVGDIVAGVLVAGDEVGISTNGAVTVVSASAGLVNPSTNPLASFSVGIESNTSITIGAVEARNDVAMASAGAITTGAITAGRDVVLLPGTNLTSGNITAGTGPTDNLYIGNASQYLPFAGLDLDIATVIAAIVADPAVRIGGTLTTGSLTGGTIDIAAQQGILVGGAIASTSALNVDTGNVFSAGDLTVQSAVTLTAPSITLGNVTAPLGIALTASVGALTTGNLTTAQSVALLGTTTITTGQITTGTAANNFVYFGNASQAAGFAAVGFDPAVVLATAPIPTAGSVAVNGGITTGSLLAASGGAFSVQGAINASSRIFIDAATSLTFGGLLASPLIDIASTDLIFGAGGAIGTANTQGLTVTARGGTVTIGGTGAGTGYVIDASEAQRLRANSININAPTAALVDLQAMTLNGANAASGINLNGPTGSFNVSAPGTIRLSGNVVFNSMAPTNEVNLSGQTIAVVGETGGIFLNGNSPGGTLTLTADNILAAEADLLAQLISDPFFAGRELALAQSFAVARPGGLIQAATINFNATDTLLIQNSGTILNPAGFYGNLGSVFITALGGPTAPLDVIISGQLLAADGVTIIGGADVRDALFPNGVPADLSTVSSINGCVVGDAVCLPPVAVDVLVDVVVSTVRDQVIRTGGAGEDRIEDVVDQEEEEEREEEAVADAVRAARIESAVDSEGNQATPEEAAAAAQAAASAAEAASEAAGATKRPIMPPISIVNTRPLTTEPVIDEPVTSGGNPNFLGDSGPANDAGPGEQP